MQAQQITDLKVPLRLLFPEINTSGANPNMSTSLGLQKQCLQKIDQYRRRYFKHVVPSAHQLRLRRVIPVTPKRHIPQDFNKQNL